MRRLSIKAVSICAASLKACSYMDAFGRLGL